jgi:hypothetical protein
VAKDFNIRTSNRSKLSPLEKVRNALIGNRLNLSEQEAEQLLLALQKQASQTLTIPANAIQISSELSGRDLDFLLTINRQNTPSKK